MLCIRLLNRDPFYNLAAEEYLLKNSGDDIFMLWQSDPVVVVGKHQNALAELNYRFIRANGIAVARRLTGGGTVYHDRGNINFTFIRKGESGRLVDFGSFIAPVLEFLKKAGVEAVQGPKNEILFNGKKISGNAEHIYKNRVLHHGTLLYNADLNQLRESIKPNEGRFHDRAVQSNRSSVLNLADCLNPRPDIEEFISGFFSYMTERYEAVCYSPDDNERNAIQELARRKYGTWEWIYGWSPDYTYYHDFRNQKMSLNIELSAHRGIITRCILKSDSFSIDMLELLSEKLTETPHEENSIRERLIICGFGETLNTVDLSDLVFAFFG
jgi:lipoate-protein ligase A